MIKGFSVDIYDSDISFAWDTNEKELNAFVDKIELSDEGRKQFFDNVGDLDGGGAVTFTYGDSTNCIVIFKDTPNNKVVAHELYHVAYRICTLRGIECEEAWAYLIGYLTEMFYDMYISSDGDK